MKLLGFILFLTIQLSVFGQSEQQIQSFKKISQIFDNYIKQKQNTDSKDNKIEMELALKLFQTKCDVKYFPTLVEIWMYYDPTDFPTRDLVLPIILKDKSEGLKVIEARIQGRKKWETPDNAPFSDLLSLRERIIGK